MTDNSSAIESIVVASEGTVDNLEKMIEIRTEQLLETNRQLQHEINERKRAEQINRTLFQIANAVNTSRDLPELYVSIHEALGKIIDLTNFFIALYNKKEQTRIYAYFRDEYDEGRDIKNFSETGSITGEIIRKGKPLFIDQAGLEERTAKNQSLGTVSKIFLGVPLKIKDKVIGVMATQSYDDPDHYDHLDLEILNAVSDQVALAIDRKQAEEKMQRLHSQLVQAQKMETIGRLAGGVAHDLNNILSGVVSYPELLLLDLHEDHRMRKKIEIIRDSGLRASAIVEDLLTVARGIAIAKESINIRSVIEDYLQSPDFKMIERDHPEVTLSTDLGCISTNIMGSQVHIRKILMNLVLNSFEASDPSGQVTISLHNKKIEATSQRNSNIEKGDYVVLSVADNGTGIAAEDLDKIFEPFYSKKMMERSGTGLGLTIVWNVVQDHNGYISVSSTDEMTQFTLHFPLTHEVEQMPKPSFDIGHLKGNGECILVVDDDKIQRLITSNIIKKLGYSVESVSSGEQAIEYLQRQPVDLVVLDMIMTPGISGRITYERIIQMYPNQKAIIVSGYAKTKEVKETLELGSCKFLNKPLIISEFAAVISNELNPIP